MATRWIFGNQLNHSVTASDRSQSKRRYHPDGGSDIALHLEGVPQTKTRADFFSDASFCRRTSGQRIHGRLSGSGLV